MFLLIKQYLTPKECWLAILALNAHLETELGLSKLFFVYTVRILKMKTSDLVFAIKKNDL